MVVFLNFAPPVLLCGTMIAIVKVIVFVPIMVDCLTSFPSTSRSLSLAPTHHVFSLCDLDLTPVLRTNSCFVSPFLQIVPAEEQLRARKDCQFRDLAYTRTPS